MRTTLFLLLTLAAAGCNCGPGQPPPRCTRVLPAQSGLRELEPFFERTPVTVRVNLNTNGTESCPAPELETWTVEVVDQNNDTIPATVVATSAPYVLIQFVAGSAGAYHTTLSNGFERFQFELPISRDRRDAGSIELPFACFDVQLSSPGLFLCQLKDGGYSVWSQSLGELAQVASPLSASGDVIWSWTHDSAVRLVQDGGCLANETGACASPVGLAVAKTDWSLYTAIAPNPDTLHIARNPGNNQVGRLTTFRADGGTSAAQFAFAGPSSNFGLVSAGDRVFAVGTGLGNRDSYACAVPVDGDGGVVRLDGGSCQLLPGGIPVGFDPDGVFTRNAAQNVFWRRDGSRFVLAFSSPRGATTSAASSAIVPHNDWPFEPGVHGFDYALALDDQAIIHEVFASDMKIRGSDRRIVWGLAPGANTTRIFFR